MATKTINRAVFMDVSSSDLGASSTANLWVGNGIRDWNFNTEALIADTTGLGDASNRAEPSGKFSRSMSYSILLNDTTIGLSGGGIDNWAGKTTRCVIYDHRGGTWKAPANAGVAGTSNIRRTSAVVVVASSPAASDDGTVERVTITGTVDGTPAVTGG